MAGKFVSIEEAARLLGKGVDEVKRLVAHKKLFPLVDGKFKVEEIERVKASLGDESSVSESLSLDLDLPLTGAEDLSLGAAVDVGDLDAGTSADAGSQTIVRGGAAAGSASDLSGLALGDDDDDTASDSADLALESIIGASSPSLSRPASGSGSLVGSTPGGDPLTLDLSGIAAGSGIASGVEAAGASESPGSGFAAPLDSGLSLEDGGIAVSGIDLDVGPVPGSGVEAAGGSLAGDAFELGADAGEEDSASVVIATEESGDSSFFANAIDDSASVAFDESSAIDSSTASILGAEMHEVSVDMRFSAWQIAGLICCSLILLAGGFVMYDLAWAIRASDGSPFSAPLLNALSETFGWRG